MADFSVDFGNVKNSAENFNEISKKLQRIAQESNSTFSKLRRSFVSKHIRSINSAGINEDIICCANSFEKLSKAAQEASSVYQKYEKAILSGDIPGESTGNSSGGKQTNDKFVNFSKYMSSSDALKNVKFRLLERFGYVFSHIGVWEFLKHTVGMEDYDKKIRENAIRNTIKRTQNINVEVDSTELDMVSQLSNYEDIMRALLSVRGISGERIDAIFEAAGTNGITNLGKLASTGKRGIEIVLFMIQDYNSAIEQLEKMRDGMIAAGADEYAESVSNVIDQYNNKFASISGSLIDGAVEKIIEEAAAKVSGGAYTAVTLAIDGVSAVTGLDEHSEAVMNLEINDGYVNAVTQAYNSYANKLRLGDYTQADVQKCQEMFEIAKSAQLNQLEDMAKICKGDDLLTVQSQIDELKRTNWDGSVDPSVGGGGGFR